MPCNIYRLIFPLLNVRYKWPIKLRSKANRLEVFDTTSGVSIFAARPSRLRRYKVGLDNFLFEMLENYCVGSLTFKSAPVIIDVGANIGEFSIASHIFLHSKARFICIEPDPVEFSALSQNLEKFGSENSVGLKCALSNISGKFEFFLNNDSGDSSLIQNFNHQPTIMVETKTLDEIVASILGPEEVIAIIKVEAEGWEPEVLLGAKNTLNQTLYVTADLGPERVGKTTYLACKTILVSLGFEEIMNRKHRYLFKNCNLTSNYRGELDS